MDLANLDKMKVVDLRNELQTRGLDYKGVKAVLIERLRAHLEGGDVPPSPGTPGRRSRRTRSMTRSPSPSPVKKESEVLETLEEEEFPEGKHDKVPDEYISETKAEISNEEKLEEKPLGTSEHDTLGAPTNGSNMADQQSEEQKQCIVEAEKDASKDDETERREIQEEHKMDAAEDVADAPNDIRESSLKNNESIGSRSRSRSRSRSKSKSPSPCRSRSPKRRSSGTKAASPKAVEDTSTPEDEPTIEDKQFGLSWYDSDLHLRIDPVTFTSAKPMNHDVYSLIWSGARANYGVREGKVCFEVRLSEESSIGRENAFRDEPYTKGFRVGFSIPNSSLLLGESENSFAYCETGRKATNGQFSDFGKSYQLDDVVGCYLDLESSPCTIKYTLNGEDLGIAFEFNKSILGDEMALFPHILTKGYEYQVNFADNDNLLVNMERKVRKRRKPKKICDNKDVEKAENNKVEEKSNKDDKNTEDQNKEATTDCGAKDEEAKSGDGKESNNENLQERDTDNKQTLPKGDSSDDCKAKEMSEDDVEMAQDTEKITVSENKKEGEEINITKDEKKNEDKSKEDDCGPSPTKRQKMEAVDEEDEYEEIHPVPREVMSLLSNYELIALIPEEMYMSGPQRPDSRKDCEVILMVGLPGAGKTTWVLNHIKENPDKRYYVIGSDSLISKMTVDGEPRKSVHKGRFDRIYELCFNVLTSLEDIAVKRRRNFILDQGNVYASVQRRKMKGFGDFKRKAVVCIPPEDELKRRRDEKKEKGHAYAMRESTLHSFQANFTLPSLEFGWFDEIIFTDLSGDEAKEEVKKYNEKGKKASKRDKRERRDNYGNDNRRRYDDRRRYDNRWNDRRTGGGGGSGGGNKGYGGGYDQRRYSSGGQNWVQNSRNRYDSNWMHNNRNRYDDRNSNRYSTGGNRYDSYGGGGGSRDYRSGGDNRDYRDRNRGAGGGTRRDSYRSGGSTNQRDFRDGHRGEDSRGGSNKGGSSSNFKSTPSGSNSSSYDKYNKNNSNSSQASSKYNTYQPQQQTQPHGWQQYNVQQSGTSGQPQYWNYDMQGYGDNQQWQTMDPQQQQQWMSWWQQQGNSSNATATDANQYWSQYCYTTPETSADGNKK
ncbi:uncharacterized protein LOC142241712 isoform X2 [Haematobia irritans]|uniref:uncharacterized protein LOC142241712 isoform X2 n=1 Tax=Haematobia irritans TaxID=7368 RepID=UPI003F4F5C32